jgi:hypothetical protein
MNATVELRGPSTGSVFDPDTMSSTAAPGPLLWTGAARVQALTGDARAADQAAQQITSRGYLVQLDEREQAVPALQPDRDILTVLATTNDALLVGRPMVIRDVQFGSERFTRDLVVQDTLG